MKKVITLSTLITLIFTLTNVLVAQPPLPEPPPNDLCVVSIPLTVFANGQCTGNESSSWTTLASQDGAEASCDPGTLGDSWWSFNSGANTSIILEVTRGTASPFIGMELFTSCGNPLPAGTITPICELDVSGQTTISGFPGTPTDYIMRIFTNVSFDTPGTYSICLMEGNPPPVNDECANATSITQNSFCTATSFTGSGATESLESCANGGNADDDVWFLI